MNIRKQATGVYLINYRNKFLLHLRDDKPWIYMPNLWAGLGGQVEENESPQECALREIMEEIGHSPEVLHFFELRKVPGMDIHLFYGRTSVEDASKFYLTEGRDLQFFTREEVSELYKKGKTNDLVLDHITLLSNLLGIK